MHAKMIKNMDDFLGEEMFCLLEIRRQQQSLKMDMVWWL